MKITKQEPIEAIVTIILKGDEIEELDDILQMAYEFERFKSNTNGYGYYSEPLRKKIIQLRNELKFNRK